ncbi:MAG: glycosyltransferase [Patescibacteria group bacterium]
MISIIIPTKNAADHLANLLASLVEQTYSDFEVIVNDDKSTTDNTVKLLGKFDKKLKIKYFRENVSMAQGRKSGAGHAEGKYQLHLDADMSLSPQVLEFCIKEINKGNDALIIPEISYGKGFWAKVKSFERSMYVGDETIESVRFVKASVYNRIGGHNEKMVLSEDKDLDLRIRKAGFKVGRINEFLYHNEGTLSLKKDLQKKFFYGKTAHIYIAENPKQALNQANLIFRAAYFRHWKKILANPTLSLGMFLMKTLETLAALWGLINTIQVIFTDKTLENLKDYEPMKERRVEKDLVSIIIPALNASNHLKNLLPSLVKQTYKNFEVIINDDIKTKDDTKQLLNFFAKKVKLKHLQENISMAQGRKSASVSAKGEYLLHLDADMKLAPQVLEQCIKKIKGFDALVIPEVSYGKGWWASVKIFERSMYVGDDTIESARFFKTSVYKSVGGHNEKMVLSEDKDLDLRVRKSGYNVGRINEPIYHNEGNFSIFNSMKKKFYYGRTASILMLANPAFALKYGNIVFRPAFFRNWRKLLSHPILACSVFLMKSLETIAGLSGMITSKAPFLKEDIKVGIWK